MITERLSENCIVPSSRKVLNRANRAGTGYDGRFAFVASFSHSRRQSRERGLASVSTRQAAFDTPRRPVALRAHYHDARVLRSGFPALALFIPAAPSGNAKSIHGAFTRAAGNNTHAITRPHSGYFDKNGGLYG